MEAIPWASIDEPENPDRDGEKRQQNKRPRNESGFGADQAERQCQKEGHRRIAHHEKRLDVFSPRFAFQVVYSSEIVWICTVRELLPGSPIGEEVPLGGILVAQPNGIDNGHQTDAGKHDTSGSENAPWT